MPRTVTELFPERNQVIFLGKNSFDPISGTLSGKDGQAIKMRAQTRSVLKALLDNSGSPVSKSDLIDKVWRGTIVTDDSLTQCISELRKLLGDQNYKIIETFPKIGYQINIDRRDRASVEPEDLPTSLSVAVHSFADVSAESERGFLGNAIMRELSVALSKCCDFSVVGPQLSSQERVANHASWKQKDLVGAQYVVEGSQQKIGDIVRVSVSLIDVSSGKTVWANTYERDLENLKSTQNDIVEVIAVAVSEKIGDRLPDGGLSENSAIYLSLCARRSARRYTREDNLDAKGFNQQAIENEPNSPIGYIGMAIHYLHQYIFKWCDEDARQETLELGEYFADQALTRGRYSEMAHRTRGMFHLERGEIEWAGQRFARALDINPYNPNVSAHLAMLLPFSRQTLKAVDEIEHALRVLPNPLLWMEGAYAWILWMNGDYQKSLEVSQRQAQIPESNTLCLIATYVCLDQIENARKNMAAFLIKNPDHCLARERAIEQPKYDFPEDGERWLDALRAAGLPENP